MAMTCTSAAPVRPRSERAKLCQYSAEGASVSSGAKASCRTTTSSPRASQAAVSDSVRGTKRPLQQSPQPTQRSEIGTEFFMGRTRSIGREESDATKPRRPPCLFQRASCPSRAFAWPGRDASTLRHCDWPADLKYSPRMPWSWSVGIPVGGTQNPSSLTPPSCVASMERTSWKLPIQRWTLLAQQRQLKRGPLGQTHSIT